MSSEAVLMAPRLGTRWRAFWHTMTSYDRHASHDSPYRTGQHVPLNTNRHAPLTSIATSGIESRPDLTAMEDGSLMSPTVLPDGYPASPTSVQSPTSPYFPGMRSSSAAARKQQTNGAEVREPTTAGEIQLQSFHDGLPPPPPVSHSWKRIDRWAEDHYQELFDQLAEGASNNDLNELEHMLDCSLPVEVRDSLQIHDGQERGGMPTGIIFGCMLLDCEEIVQEWQQWRAVNQQFLSDHGPSRSVLPSRVLSVASGSSNSQPGQPRQNGGAPAWRQELLAKQDSQPSGAVIKAYAHPAWIPLARDWGGNNIAVDLSPGPTGTWGQIILFGRDYDCKYVVARSWAAFLATVADDLGSDKWLVDEETQELKLKEFKTDKVEPGYLDILRWRMDQKYGRKGAKRRPGNGLTVNSNASGVHGKSGSPYGSPVATEFERGRSMHRFGGAPAASSPKARHAKSSPLAKVSEETAGPVAVHSGGTVKREQVTVKTDGVTKSSNKLVEAPTPIEGPRLNGETEGRMSSVGSKDGILGNGIAKGLGVVTVDGDSQDITEDNTLRSVDL